MRKYVLDLSEIYSDHRSKAYLGHRPTWTSIHSLIQTVKEIFGIRSHVHVCSAEHIFYPDSESVEILQDGETLRILPEATPIKTKQISDWEDDTRRLNETDNPQESTFEDIESVLCLLPKRKRRRVRKRKVKKVSQDEPHTTASEATIEKRNRNDEKTNGNLSDSERKEQVVKARKLSSSEMDERPYRNLNRRLKARVVRAASLSTLSTPPPDEVFVSPPSEQNGCALDETLRRAHPESSTVFYKKARVVRAISLQNTVEVKRELIEAIGNGHLSTSLDTAQQGKITAPQTESDKHNDDREVSPSNDMETYSTIVSDV
ncbi:uncharacterized protein LOC131281350 [Anopheles ziemanni]|uniref:uncharacterized protein LOC131263540 n=1 Tax=Anopheles coustani TaxID=139045 RepID=UPI002658FF9A|nr:uncharacterized protein LOC131263540 [Anopheles coustani]XP_058166660.1 uncharacterized protein LOC131281350 [Anopheles ziemanni]